MFSRIRNFAQRHYRKFLVTGVIIGGAIFVKRYAERKLIEWQEREMNKLLEQSKKQQHFESTERTCNSTVVSLFPKLQSSISKALDSDSVTLLLKNKAHNKRDLWEQLKIIAFSRIMSYIYCNSILMVLLRAQINILGAYLFVGNKNPGDPRLELSPTSQSQFLSTSNYLLNSGIEKFCELVEKVARRQLSGLSLKDRVNLVDIERILHDLRIGLENEICQQPADFLVNFILDVKVSSSNPTINKMTNEMREILENREVRDLISNCATVGVTSVLDKLAESMNSLTEETSGEFVHPNEISVYVAKLIPVLNNFIHSDIWLQQLLKLEPIRTFGANIYESFTSQHV